MDSPEVDQRLIQASLAGDTDAFGELVRSYQDRLYATLYRLTGSVEDAQDLVQETFLRAYQNLDRFLGESAFYTWIYRIGVNLVLNRRRRARSGPRFLPFRRGGDHDQPDPGDPREHAASDQLESRETAEQVQRALDRLPKEFRSVVVLKDFDGLRYEEIAELLKIPIGTVRSRLHRARGELRALLGESPLDPALSSPASLPVAET
ncbi:MAG: RNA polymerase sigma factor [Isosphaeraceae bacterium]|jgi:RNA polymerase sigma-70 factor (ECF subfamily)|nr:MAG: RNA polymerase sigma factor [Isosphaeraceae bacterium]